MKLSLEMQQQPEMYWATNKKNVTYIYMCVFEELFTSTTGESHSSFPIGQTLTHFATKTQSKSNSTLLFVFKKDSTLSIIVELAVAGVKTS